MKEELGNREERRKQVFKIAEPIFGQNLDANHLKALKTELMKHVSYVMEAKEEDVGEAVTNWIQWTLQALHAFSGPDKESSIYKTVFEDPALKLLTKRCCTC
jgi:hypothetical protein